MIRTCLRPGALLLLATSAFAGMSLVLSPGITSSVFAPPLGRQQAWRVEFQMHDWALPPGGTNIWDMNDIGAAAELLPSNVLRILDKRDGTSPSVCDLPLAGHRNVLVRIQRDPSDKRFVCELWDQHGLGHIRNAVNITAFQDWPYSGGKFGDQYTKVSLGFFRIFTTLVPMESPPPLTAATGDLTDLKFDGNTSDTSGRHHHMSFSRPVFATTPDQRPTAVIRTAGAPFWSNWVSLRAGYPATLDGSASFSLADGDSSVVYRWQQLSGPTTVRWSSYTVAKPTITGLIFGDYKFRLQVTDRAGQTASAALDIGAVATDDNGVVIQANPAADLIFGPMIALGKNPWPYQDYIALHSALVRQPYLASLSPPSWINSLPGSISFTPQYGTTPYQTKLNGGITADASTMVLADASKLDLSVLPTVIQINWRSIRESVRICGASGNTLTVCYDGRGWRQGLFNEVAAPRAWPDQTEVSQLKTSGTGTRFLTDFCPAGPGEEGQIAYNAGTVSVTAGNTTLTGAGTSWDGNSLNGLRVRIAGTHGGNPFVFFAGVASVGSPNSMALSRPWPSDADSASGLSYAILRPGKFIARNWLRPDSSTGQQLSGISSCESDTQMYQTDGDAIANYAPGHQANQRYSSSSAIWLSEFGPNYYDEVLANYANYFRSGSSLFLSSARAIGDYWAAMPELDQGYYPVTPRHAGVTGMVAGAVLDERVNNWGTIRRLANTAVTNQFSGGAILSSCDSDVREDAYGLSWIALAAMFDPVDTGNPGDPNQRSYWKAQLAKAYSHDQNCMADGVFSQPFYGGNNGTFSMTQGNNTATGVSIPQTLCPVSATGTITVSNGGTAATGSGFRADQKIVIKATRNQSPYVFYSLFKVNSPDSIVLTTPFDGDSGTYPYQIESDQNFLSFATGSADHTNLNNFYACQWVDASHITLDRPWEGSTGTFNATRAPSTYVGFGATPFQNGIKTLAMRYAALGATGSTATNYTALNQTVANWIMTNGFDPITGGLYYARGFYNCEPPGINKIGCDYGLSVDSKVAARTLSGEAQNAMSVVYQANPTQSNRSFGDHFYGAQWGKPGFGHPPYSDGVYLDTLDSDATFSYKWIGFLFGIGMSHQWPAVRLGGVQPPKPVTAPVYFDIASVSGTASVSVKVTEPSGAVASYACSSSPCQVQLDARQGAAWYQVSYLSSGGTVLSQGQPDLLQVP